MKDYVVRMIDPIDNAIVDANVYNCESEETALSLYKGRCKRHGIAIADRYYFVVIKMDTLVFLRGRKVGAEDDAD